MTTGSLVPVAQQWLDFAGAPLSAGKITFYEAGTTTPKNVYSDAGLTISLGYEVTLDSNGCATIFGSGSYKIVTKTAGGATLRTVDGVSLSSSDQLLPSQTGNSGKFLTTNGTSTSWASPYPSQTGNSGKFLTTNGTSTSWAVASGVYSKYKNIVDYGADPTGVSDSTTAIQNAINAAGAAETLIYIPQGTYKITGTLNNTSAANFMGIVGDNVETTILNGSTLTTDATSFLNAPFGFRAENFTIQGPGQAAAVTSSGFKLPVNTLGPLGAGAVTSQVSIRNVSVKQFPTYGFYFQMPIVSEYSTLLAQEIGQVGFYVDYLSSTYVGGTSTTFNNCYANNVTGKGYYMVGHEYSAMNSCAVDDANYGYYFYRCGNITMNGCGNEVMHYVDASNPGIGIYMEECGSMVVNGQFSYANNNVAGLGMYLKSSTGCTIISPTNSDDVLVYTYDAVIDAGSYNNSIINGANYLRVDGRYLVNNLGNGNLIQYGNENATPTSLSKIDISAATPIPDVNITRTGWSTSTLNYNSMTDAGGSYGIDVLGTPSANPTVKVTFTTAYPVPPIVIISAYQAASTADTWQVTNQTTTYFTATYVGTPVAGASVGFNCLVIQIP